MDEKPGPTQIPHWIHHFMAIGRWIVLVGMTLVVVGWILSQNR